MNKHKIITLSVLAVVIALAAGTLLGLLIQRNHDDDVVADIVRNNKLLYTLSFLEGHYVDSISVDSLQEALIPALLSGLDPHSEYIPAKDTKEFNDPIKGHFDGIGVTFNMATDTAIISSVISSGPSQRAGILPGDRIIVVDGDTVSGKHMPSDSVVYRLKGERGTKVNLQIERNRNMELIPIEVIRGEIPMKSVESAFMIKGKIGYIRLSRFAATTYTEMIEALNMLTQKGMDRLVFDLRNNTGGLLDQAIYVANEFLQKGQIIVSTKDIHSEKRDQRADGSGRFQDIPVVVIVNQNTASASEIVAGALQDNDRATIVGLRTFGKGLIQQTFEYYDGSMAKITIAHYMTPLGRSIQKPYVMGEKQAYLEEVFRRYLNHELTDKDSTKYDESQRFVTPKGKILYGGGGISPDVFVPIDTTELPQYFIDSYSANAIFLYATEFSDRYRQKLNSAQCMEDLEKIFSETNVFLNYVSWADKQGVHAKNGQDLNRSRSMISTQIKAFVARNSALGDDAYTYFMLPLDDDLQVALKSFN